MAVNMDLVFMQVLHPAIVPRWRLYPTGVVLEPTFWGPVVFVFDKQCWIDDMGKRGVRWSFGAIGSFDDNKELEKIEDITRFVLSNKSKPQTPGNYLHSHEVTVNAPVDLKHCVAILVPTLCFYKELGDLLRKRKYDFLPVIAYEGLTYTQVLRKIYREQSRIKRDFQGSSDKRAIMCNFRESNPEIKKPILV